MPRRRSSTGVFKGLYPSDEYIGYKPKVEKAKPSPAPPEETQPKVKVIHHRRRHYYHRGKANKARQKELKSKNKHDDEVKVLFTRKEIKKPKPTGHKKKRKEKPDGKTPSDPHYHHRRKKIKRDDEWPHFGHRYIDQHDDRFPRCAKLKFSSMFLWSFVFANIFLLAYGIVTIKRELSKVNYNDKEEYFLILIGIPLSLAIVMDLIGSLLLLRNKYSTFAPFIGYCALMTLNTFVSLEAYLTIIGQPRPSKFELIQKIEQRFPVDPGKNYSTKIPLWLHHFQNDTNCCGISNWTDFRVFGPRDSVSAVFGIVPFTCCHSKLCEIIHNRFSIARDFDQKFVEGVDFGVIQVYPNTCYQPILDQLDANMEFLSHLLLSSLVFQAIEIMIFTSFYIRYFPNFGSSRTIKRVITKKSVSSAQLIPNPEEALSLVTVPPQGETALVPDEVEEKRQVQLQKKHHLPESFWTSTEDLQQERLEFDRIPYKKELVVGPKLDKYQLADLATNEHKRLKRVHEDNLRFQELQDELAKDLSDRLFQQEPTYIKIKRARLEGRSFEIREVKSAPKTPEEKIQREAEEIKAEVWPWEDDYTPRKGNVLTEPRPSPSQFPPATKAEKQEYKANVKKLVEPLPPIVRVDKTKRMKVDKKKVKEATLAKKKKR